MSSSKNANFWGRQRKPFLFHILERHRHLAEKLSRLSAARDATGETEHKSACKARSHTSSGNFDRNFCILSIFTVIIIVKNKYGLHAFTYVFDSEGISDILTIHSYPRDLQSTAIFYLRRVFMKWSELSRRKIQGWGFRLFAKMKRQLARGSGRNHGILARSKLSAFFRRKWAPEREEMESA